MIVSADGLIACSQLIAQYPSHPMVVDLARKSEQFDELSMKFTVPPLATAA